MATAPEILNLTQAAKRAGVSKPAILQAVDRGRLKRREDGAFDAAAVDAYARGRRSPRGGKPGDRNRGARPLSKAQPSFPQDFMPLVDAAPGSPFYGVPDRIADVALAVTIGVEGLANILARHLPVDLVRLVVEEYLADEIAGWVGGPGRTTTCVADEDDWPPAPDCGAWHAHPAFRLEIPAWAWDKAAAVGNAWRAERGLSPL